ncbi:porin [uncultured Lutibacter sp.]|uniref:OprO/OprP family phosphate-selective porin n=1 Tax=uncultured Lutibacter sp. TaxID=437739 RepID=UPI002621C316|nr:porin [uncultured Lutibacter sp.]
MKKIYFTLLAIGLVVTSVIGQENQLSVESDNGGILLTSPEKDYQVKFNGRIYMDGTHYMDDVTDLSSKVSITDVRLGTTIKWDKWDAKINVSFGNDDLSIKDAFLRYNYTKKSVFTIGNFFEPFGIEAAASSKELRFIGASNTTQALGIGRGIGLGYTYHTDKFYGATGLFAGSVDNQNKGDQGYSSTTKLAYTPIVNDNLTLQVGASFSYRKPEANGFSAGLNDDDFNREVVLTAGPENLFLNADIKGAISDTKYNFQTLVISKSFLLQGEYTRSNVTRDEDYVSNLMKDGPLYYVTYAWPTTPQDYADWYGELKDITTEAYYVQTGFLLGDTYSYNSSTAYINRPKAGSYEFLVRYDNTNLNDIDGTYFNGSFGPADEGAALGGAGNKSIAGGKSETISAAVNYYLSDNIMFRLNYSVMDVDNIKHPLDEKVGILNARVQVNF